jgi:hypothetical protein
MSAIGVVEQGFEGIKMGIDRNEDSNDKKTHEGQQAIAVSP